MILHPFQKKIVQDAARMFREINSLCIVLPTGGGKTVIAGDISVRLFHEMRARKGVTCLYLVHRSELLWQTVKTLRKFGLAEQVGIIASGHSETPWAPLQIASVQTLVNRLDKLTWLNPRMIFIDEAHHVRASTWEKILAHYPEAFRCGLTATAARLDGKGMGAHFRRILLGPEIPWLAANGYLAKVDSFSLPGMNHAGLKMQGGDYSKKQMDERASGPIIAEAVKNINKYARDRRSLFYAVSRRHSREVVDGLNEIGIVAEHVDGETPYQQRVASMRRFESGSTHLISNVNLFSEGLDVPECDCVIHGRPSKSLTYVRQANGRTMRVKHDGRRGLIVDLAGNLHEHGGPDEEIEWSLDDGIVKDSAIKAVSNTRTCGDCRYVYPSRKGSCPLCGSVHLVKTAREVEIELEEFKREKYAEKNRKQGLKRMRNKEILDSMGDHGKLVDIAHRYGCDANALHVWKRVFKPMWDRERRRGGVRV